MKKNVLKHIIDILLIMIGTAIFSVGFIAFVEPNDITVGGVTGLAALINHMFPKISTGVLVVLINLPLLYLCVKKFKLETLLKTGIATVFMSIFIDLFTIYLPTYTGDKVISALAGGVLCGAGMVCVFMRSATTGGVDIVAKLLNKKYPFLSVGKIMLFVDGLVIIAASLVYHSIETALYSILFIFASSNIIDMLLYGADKGKLIFIVSEQPDLIKKAIVEELNRGVTEIKSSGGYTGKDRNMLMCAVRNSEIGGLMRIIKHNDPTSFIVSAEAGEILGQGFKEL